MSSWVPYDGSIVETRHRPQLLPPGLSAPRARVYAHAEACQHAQRCCPGHSPSPAMGEQVVHAASQSSCSHPLAKTAGPCTTRAPRPKPAVDHPNLRQQMERVTTKKGNHYLIQGMGDAVSVLRNVQREHFTRVDDKRDHARSDKNCDENRSDWVEARPPVVLYKQRRYDHTDRAKRVLLVGPFGNSVSRRKRRDEGEGKLLTAMTCKKRPRML